MKIKRFFAKDMRTVLKEVKDELGVDAVIMSNKKLANGVEIVAAVDYDKAAPKKEQAVSAPAQSSTKTQPVHPVKQKKGLAPKSKPNKKKKENSGQRKKRN